MSGIKLRSTATSSAPTVNSYLYLPPKNAQTLGNDGKVVDRSKYSMAQIITYIAPLQYAGVDGSWITIAKNGVMELVGVYLLTLMQLTIASTLPGSGLVGRLTLAAVTAIATYLALEWRRMYMGHRSLNPALSLALMWPLRVSIAGLVGMAPIQLGGAALAALTARSLIGAPLPIPESNAYVSIWQVAALTAIPIFVYIFNLENNKIDMDATNSTHERRVNYKYALALFLTVLLGTTNLSVINVWMCNPAIYLGTVIGRVQDVPAPLPRAVGDFYGAHIFAPFLGSAIAVVACALLYYINNSSRQDGQEQNVAIFKNRTSE